MNAATQLEGREIGDGWRVVQIIRRPPDGTGGNFSSSYIVEREGTRAFLKAMDLSLALRARDLLAALRLFTDAIQFEGDLLEICKARSLSRVVRLLDEGILPPPLTITDPTAAAASQVFYFIFELAERDVRHRFSTPTSTNASIKLSALHQTAVAIDQLHGSNIAHQDVKPSNVVNFPGDEHKLADLGSASMIGRVGPKDHLPFAGDQNYMPPEYAYGYIPPEAVDRRFGTDIYQLGSLLAFLFSLQGASTLLRHRLPPHLLPFIWAQPPTTPWSGTFADVLPHLVTAHGEVTTYLRGFFPPHCAAELATAYYELSHPDPAVRGHPRSRAMVGRQLGTNRYISLFDRLRKSAGVHERIAFQAAATQSR